MSPLPIDPSAAAEAPPPRHATMWWAGVLSLALFSFYVHVLHEPRLDVEGLQNRPQVTALSEPADHTP